MNTSFPNLRSRPRPSLLLRLLLPLMAIVVTPALGFSEEMALQLPRTLPGLEASAAMVSTLGSENLVTHETSLWGLSLVNNFLFFAPPLVWNAVLWQQIPNWYFSGSAPSWLVITENVFRTASMAYAAILPIDAGHELFMPGLAVYSVGMLAYIASWLVLSYLPDSTIAQSEAMRLAPAYLPIVWLGGISMMAQSPLLMVLSTAFVGFHVAEFALKYTP